MYLHNWVSQNLTVGSTRRSINDNSQQKEKNHKNDS